MILTEQHKLIMKGLVCPYCKRSTELIRSTEVYAKDYGRFWMYICKFCKAHVSCHKKTKDAMGRVAKLGLRFLKKDAHEAFDKIWKSNLMKRQDAYQWLSKELKIPREYTHIGMFGEKTCQQVIALSNEFIANAKAHKNIS